MAGGTAPDVFLWWNFPSLVARNGIQDLTELVQGPNGHRPCDLLQGSARLQPCGQRSLWPSQGLHPAAAYYFNKKLFDDAGVAYPTADWTTNDLLEMAKALTKGEDGPDKQYGILHLLRPVRTAGLCLAAWRRLSISPDGTKATGYADSDATTSVLDWHAGMNLKEGVAPTAQAVSRPAGWRRSAVHQRQAGHVRHRPLAPGAVQGRAGPPVRHLPCRPSMPTPASASPSCMRPAGA